jgi:ribonuclease D
MNHNGNIPYQFIDSPLDLKKACRELERTTCVAVDLEADSMYHYKEKVCLIQLTTGQTHMLIDPLGVKDISILKPIFAQSNIQKIFHGADYDVRSLFRDFQISISNLFDTQLACRFLGIRETGLEAVLWHRFNVQLDKRFQKKDWSQRPLPKKMVEYAITDVRYLIPLAEQLRKELEEKDRLDWVHEECRHLSNVRHASNNTEPLYVKFKGAGRLNSRSLAILEALLQLREQIAESKDKPLFKILRNKTLMNVAVMKTANLKILEKRQVLSRKQVVMYGDAIKGAIAGALALPVTMLPKYPHTLPPRQSPKVRKRIRALKAWRHKKAKDLKLETGVICNKALMFSISEKNPRNHMQLGQIKEMRKWQRDAFGSDVLQVIGGIKY